MHITGERLRQRATDREADRCPEPRRHLSKRRAFEGTSQQQRDVHRSMHKMKQKKPHIEDGND
jgi:hypothetical protein